MDYPFRVCGRIVEAYRFQVDHTEERPSESGELEQVPCVQYCPTREEADAAAEQTGGTVTALDTTGYEWLDDITMPDVPDTYGEAVTAYELGEAEYGRRLAFEEKKKADQLRADLDYVMLMGGL